MIFEKIKQGVSHVRHFAFGKKARCLTCETLRIFLARKKKPCHVATVTATLAASPFHRWYSAILSMLNGTRPTTSIPSDKGMKIDDDEAYDLTSPNVRIFSTVTTHQHPEDHATTPRRRAQDA